MSSEIAATLIVDCMTPFVVKLDKYATLAQAYEQMLTNHIRRIPIVENDKLIGIIALSDILCFTPGKVGRYLTFKELSQSLDQIIVDLVMNSEPVVVYQSDQIGYAAELMLQHKFGGLPVLDASQRLVGMVTESDIFQLLAEAWRKINSSQ